MKRIFLYPKHDRFFGSPNPYIFDFHRELAQNHRVVNRNAWGLGILNLFIYFIPTQIFIFNWIETLPQKKLWRLQVAGFIFFMWLAGILGKKIVWVLHNKGSHHQKENKKANMIFDLMMRRADKIITHSESGRIFVKEMYPAQVSKVEVIIHPIKKLFPLLNKEKTIDFLIWGSVFPYKGIDKFLNFIASLPSERKFKVKIVGKCFDGNYLKELDALLDENTVFCNEILDLEEIYQLAQESKFILFTYNSDTVISSGSLIDSIRMGTAIIGPRHGAFKDLDQFCFIKTYEDFAQIPEILSAYEDNRIQLKCERKQFYDENKWSNFIRKMDDILRNI